MRSLIAIGALGLLPAAAGAQARTTPPPHVHNRTLSTLTEGGRQVFRLDQRAGDGVAWWVWVVGGVALAAAGTTTLLLVTREDVPDRTIGPVNVTF